MMRAEAISPLSNCRRSAARLRRDALHDSLSGVDVFIIVL
jgi:hypothetical protein